jgi:hypothetical protein
VPSIVHTRHGTQMESRLENADNTLMIARALMCLSVSLLAQPSLRITSPAEGTVFHPGESIKVKVEASGTFKMVMVIGYDPLGGTFPLSAPPYEFTIQIPDRYHIAPGRYLLTADGFIEAGKSVASKSVGIKVEPADVRLKLKVKPSLLRLSVGQRDQISSSGEFPDGMTIDLTKSQQVSFRSNAPKIATVNDDGVVVAIAAGSTVIVATYQKSSVEIPVTVFPKQQ